MERSRRQHERVLPSFVRETCTQRHFEPLMQPRLSAAYRNARIDALERRVRLLAHALLECRRGVIVIDSASRVHMRSDAARAWERKYWGPGHRGVGLPGTLLRWTKQHLSSLSRGREPPPAIEPFYVDRDEDRLIVRLVPDVAGREHLLIFEERSKGADPEKLRIEGLSKREAEVLAWVTRGKSNAEIAVVLAVSVRTIQKHLEHVFEKLGVESRAAAVARTRELIG